MKCLWSFQILKRNRIRSICVHLFFGTRIKDCYQFMVMAPLLWRFAVTHGGFSLLKSGESAKAGLIQVRVIQDEI